MPIYSPSIWEAEANVSYTVNSKPTGLYSKNLPQKKKEKKEGVRKRKKLKVNVGPIRGIYKNKTQHTIFCYCFGREWGDTEA